MAKPPGKLLPLVAALLCGAVLAQAATPPDHSVTSAAPPVSPKTGHGLLGTPITSKRGEPSSTKQPAQPAKHPVAKPPADDWNLAAHGKVLYLTFDDGPQHEWTPKVLQLLRKHKAQATFFVLGIQVAQYPELIAAERAAGHTVGNHTWDHKTLTLLPDAKVRQEIATGVKSKCLRPPTGATNAKIQADRRGVPPAAGALGRRHEGLGEARRRQHRARDHGRSPSRSDHPDARRRRQPLPDRRRPRPSPDQTHQAGLHVPLTALLARDGGGAVGEVAERLVDGFDRLVQ